MLFLISHKRLGLSSSFLFFIFVLLSSPKAYSQLSSQLTQSLSQMMLTMGQVHESVKNNNEKQFKERIKHLMNELNRVQIFNEKKLAYHERAYLHRQIQQMKESLGILSFNKDSMKNNLIHLKQLNREFIYISRAYALSPKKSQYGFYFCPKDDSIWIQKTNTKTYHPFKEKYRSCGRKLR